MKIFACMLPMLIALASVAHAGEDKEKPQKIYISPSDVQVAEEGILVNLQDQIVVVKNLRSDKLGIFVLESDVFLLKNDEARSQYCRRCGITFDTYRDYARHMRRAH